MSRLSTFLCGLATGAVIVTALFVYLPTTPRVQVTIDRPSPIVAAARPSVSPLAVARPTLAKAPPPAPIVWLRTPTVEPTRSDIQALPSLLIPVAGVEASQLVDTFADARGEGRVHDAIDIMAPRGTPVFAASDGKLVKFFDSKAGGLTIYQFDPSQTYALYYAHLDSYAPGLHEGSDLRRGDVIAYVGSTGNASPEAPHLHFAIFVLGPERRWWQGTAIDPYPLLAKPPAVR